MSRLYLSQPTEIYIPGITRYQADNFYINNEEHAIFTENIDMNNQKITNLSNGTDDKDATNIGQVRQLFNSLIKIEYRHKYGTVSSTTPTEPYDRSIIYRVGTDTFHSGFVVQCRVCVRSDPQSNIFVWRDLTEINKAGYLYKATIEIDSTDLSNREPNEISTGMLPHKFMLYYVFKRIDGLNTNPNLNRYWISYVCYI